MAKEVSKFTCFLILYWNWKTISSSLAASDVALEKLQQIKMEENEAYKVHTHHSQDADLNGYYDTVEYTEEEGNDYVMNEPVYDLPS